MDCDDRIILLEKFKRLIRELINQGYTYEKICEILQSKSNDNIKFTKPTISKILKPNSEYTFKRNSDKLIECVFILDEEINNLKEIKNIPNKHAEFSEKIKTLNNNKLHTDVFVEPIFVVVRNLLNFLGFKRYINISFAVFFITIFTIIPIIWALFTNVFFLHENIDFPLVYSSTVLIGHTILSICLAFLLKQNFSLSKLIDNIENDKLIFKNNKIDELLNDKIISTKQFENHIKNKTIKFVSLIIGIIVSFFFHYTYITDDIIGWCEPLKNQFNILGLSLLGIYNFVITTLTIAILVMILFFFIATNTKLHNYTYSYNVNTEFPDYYLNNTFNEFSKFIKNYRIIAALIGLHGISTFFSLILFSLNKNHFFTWQIIHIVFFAAYYFIIRQLLLKGHLKSFSLLKQVFTNNIENINYQDKINDNNLLRDGAINQLKKLEKEITKFRPINIVVSTIFIVEIILYIWFNVF